MLPPVMRVPSKIILYQLLLISVIAGVCALFWGILTGISILIGGLTVWLPTALLVGVVFSRFRSPQGFLAWFVVAEVAKLSLAGLLFVWVVKTLLIEFLPALMGFLITIPAFGISSLVCLGRK